MKLIFATNNSHKMHEIKKAVGGFEIVGLKEAGIFFVSAGYQVKDLGRHNGL